LAWMPNGKTIHVIKSNGEKDVYTPQQIEKFGQKRLDNGDPDGQAMVDYSKGVVLKQINSKKPSATTESWIATYLPAPERNHSSRCFSKTSSSIEN